MISSGVSAESIARAGLAKEMAGRTRRTEEMEAWFVELAFNALAVSVIAGGGIVYCYCG
jgi:hypothetical protein